MMNAEQLVNIKNFTTLQDWTDFMRGRNVIITAQGPYYKEICSFDSMQGNHNTILHPDNEGGNAIRMIVKTSYGKLIGLVPGQFLVQM
jgi:hypothetical protein